MKNVNELAQELQLRKKLGQIDQCNPEQKSPSVLERVLHRCLSLEIDQQVKIFIIMAELQYFKCRAHAHTSIKLTLITIKVYNVKIKNWVSFAVEIWYYF